ncbi:MAG: hypothetical protein ABL936_21760 [Aestuariivirga sp.]
MKTVWKLSGVLAMSLVLVGCGGASRLLGGMGLGGSDPAPQAPVVRTGNNLALPPDLQLRPPGTVTETYQPTPPPAPVQTASAEEGLYAPITPAPVVKKDIYAEYGISKTKPDGTPKLEGDLKAELKQAMIKRKRETNPGYGTVRNIGNIFSDG